MQVMMGNDTPHKTIVNHDDPIVYYWGIHDSAGYTHLTEGRPNGRDALLHVLTSQVTHLPDHECFVSVANDWPNHSPVPPAWVWSNDADFAQMLAEAYGCPVGIPDDIEDRYHTYNGPPGTGPAPAPEEVPTEA